jgi:hypothetical protein
MDKILEKLLLLSKKMEKILLRKRGRTCPEHRWCVQVQNMDEQPELSLWWCVFFQLCYFQAKPVKILDLLETILKSLHWEIVMTFRKDKQGTMSVKKTSWQTLFFFQHCYVQPMKFDRSWTIGWLWLWLALHWYVHWKQHPGRPALGLEK